MINETEIPEELGFKDALKVIYGKLLRTTL